MLVSGSILCDNPLDAVKKYDKSSVDYIHLDIMDGKFVKNKSFTMSQIEKFCSYTNKKLDVHLMVNNPIKYIDDFSMFNTSYITFHYEATNDVERVINHIKNYGIKAGISIKPSTNVSEIFKFLPHLDMVLIMCVEPGESYQQFMDSVIYKVNSLRREIDEKGYKTIISVDGGINEMSAHKVKDAHMAVSCSYLLSGEIENNIQFLRSL